MASDSRARSVASLRVSALLLLLTLPILGSAGCSHSPPPRKLIVLGIDGLEWRLVLKFAQAGKLPNLSALLANGVSGKLETLKPTHSPAIWTTIATGKKPQKHGILDFAFQDESGEPHLFTSVYRKSKALWNLLDDADRSCDVLGWWCTFPVEKSGGVMVSQTCMRTQIDVSDGHKIWKGTYLRGVPGQVQPPEFEARVRATADRIYGNSKASMRALADPKQPLTPLVAGLWDGLSSSFVADQLYADLARDRLKSGNASEAVLLYLGTTDVASHRFWRYLEPEFYDHPPRAEELADFGRVIEASYVFADSVLGDLRALAPDADFVVLSDHGFHAVNPHGRFSDGAPAADRPFISGEHQDAPPGFFLASGPGFRAGTCASDAAHVPVVGRVEDVLPTLLWRLGIPFGEDMDGRPMRDVLSEATLAAAPQRAVKSHEDEDWQKQRAQARAHAAEDEKHFEQAALRALDGTERQRLSNLGYTGPGLPPPNGTKGDGEKEEKQNPAAKPTADSKAVPADSAPDAQLPKGFPKPDEPRGLRVKASGTRDGYVLVAPLNSTSINLLDLEGNVKHTWKTSNPAGGAVYFLPNGLLLRCGVGGRIQELDWDGKVVWNFDLDNYRLMQHHDVLPLANGHVLMIAWEYHSREEAIAHGRMAEFCEKEGLWSDVLIEVKPSPPISGAAVWMWRSWDHLVQDQDPKQPGYGKIEERAGSIDINVDCRHQHNEGTEKERAKREKLAREMKRLGYVGAEDVDKLKSGDKKPADAPAPARPVPATGLQVQSDWMHTNSVDYSPEQDLILLSPGHLSEIYVIDHSTTIDEAASEKGGRWKHGGALLYRYGNPRNYGFGEISDRKLFYQHNAQWLPGSKAGELHVLVYNNGLERPVNEYSSVEELALPFDPKTGFQRDPKSCFGPDEPVWSYSEPEAFYSPMVSGAQRLPNGNTLVCEGAKGRAFEVSREGKILWDFWSPLGGDLEPSENPGKAPANALFRATWLPKDFAGLKGKL